MLRQQRRAVVVRRRRRRPVIRRERRPVRLRTRGGERAVVNRLALYGDEAELFGTRRQRVHASRDCKLPRVTIGKWVLRGVDEAHRLQRGARIAVRHPLRVVERSMRWYKEETLGCVGG